MVKPRLTATLITTIIFCLLMIYASQKQVDLDIWFARSNNSETTYSIPLNSKFWRTINLGFNRLTADLLWLNTIQYLGTNSGSQDYPSLGNMIKTVTEIDPKFEYPYLFGGIILPWQGEPEVALELLELGWKEFPENGLFPYNAGAIARIQLNNPELAARYFQQSIGLKNTPAAAAILAGANLSKLSNREFALAWWNSILETEKNESVREREIVWRDHLTTVITLEKLVDKAKQDGYVINKLSDLVDYGFIQNIPTSPLNGTLYLDSTTGLVDLKTN